MFCKLLVFPFGTGYLCYMTSLPLDFMPPHPDLKRGEQILGVIMLERLADGSVLLTQYVQVDLKLNKAIVTMGVPLLKRNLVGCFGKLQKIAKSLSEETKEEYSEEGPGRG